MQFVHSIKGNVVKLSLSKFVIKEVLKLTELTDKKVIMISFKSQTNGSLSFFLYYI